MSDTLQQSPEGESKVFLSIYLYLDCFSSKMSESSFPTQEQTYSFWHIWAIVNCNWALFFLRCAICLRDSWYVTHFQAYFCAALLWMLVKRWRAKPNGQAGNLCACFGVDNDPAVQTLPGGEAWEAAIMIMPWCCSTQAGTTSLLPILCHYCIIITYYDNNNGSIITCPIFTL